MEIKVQQMVTLDEEAFEEIFVEYLKKAIERAEDEGNVHGPTPPIIEAMKLTHDWFSLPSDWYFTVEELEGFAAKKPAKMKAKKK